MNKKINLTERDNNKRWGTLEDLIEYTTLKRFTATKLADDAGARKKIGRRVIYDFNKIDEYLEKLEG